jgi:hypothetical protein
MFQLSLISVKVFYIVQENMFTHDPKTLWIRRLNFWFLNAVISLWWSEYGDILWDILIKIFRFWALHRWCHNWVKRLRFSQYWRVLNKFRTKVLWRNKNIKEWKTYCKHNVVFDKCNLLRNILSLMMEIFTLLESHNWVKIHLLPPNIE